MLRLEQAHHAIRRLHDIGERQTSRRDGIQTDHLRRGIHTQSLVLFERNRGRILLAVAFVLNGDIVLTGSLADSVINVHPGRARYAIDRIDRVAALDSRLGGNRTFVDLTDHIGIHRHGDACDGIDAHKEQEARQDIDDNAREQHKATLEKALAQIGMRALTRKEFGLAAGRFPRIALGSRMFAIETTAVKGGMTGRVTRQGLVLGGIVTVRRLLPFFVPGSDGAPTQQQGTGLEHNFLGQLELDGKIGDRHTTVAIDGSEYAVGT